MNKNLKRLTFLLVVVTFLATPMGHAASLRYGETCYSTNRPINQNKYVITYYNYPINYLQNIYGNTIIKYNPNWLIKPIIPPENNKHANTNNDQNKKDITVPEKNSNKPVTDTNTGVNKPTPDTNTGVNGPTPDTNADVNRPTPDTNAGASTSIEMEVVRLINIERQKAGLASLNYSGELSKIARMKSQDMASKNYFSHNSPTYGDPFTMMKDFGIKYAIAGENIAKGYLSAESVVKGWMNSTGHRDNILNPSFGNMGIGYVSSNGTTYWTQMFTN